MSNSPDADPYDIVGDSNSLRPIRPNRLTPTTTPIRSTDRRAAPRGTTSGPINVFDGRGSLVDGIPRAVSDPLRYIITRHQLNDGRRLPSPLAITSALHGEGVTTISRSIASIIAHDLDATVCWIDLSWAASAQHDPNDTGRPGIFEVLTGQASLEDAVTDTGDPRVFELRGGVMPDAQRQQVARSAPLGDLIAEVSTRVSFVVLDLPPLLAGSEGLAMLRHANAYLMVVRHGATTSQQVNAAAAELESITSLGVVLNRAKSRVPKRLLRLLS